MSLVINLMHPCWIKVLISQKIQIIILQITQGNDIIAQQYYLHLNISPTQICVKISVQQGLLRTFLNSKDILDLTSTVKTLHSIQVFNILYIYIYIYIYIIANKQNKKHTHIHLMDWWIDLLINSSCTDEKTQDFFYSFMGFWFGHIKTFRQKLVPRMFLSVCNSFLSWAKPW